MSYSYQGNGNVGGTGSASWHPSGIYSAGYNWLYGGINGGGSSGTNFSDLRATIFYDYNNTNYYVDPAGTARLSYVVSNGGIRIDGNEDLYLDYNYGCSVVGVYASTRYQGVFSMGNAYKLARDGTTTGNLYGLAWSHPNAGGVAGNLNDHGLLVLTNGGWCASLTGSTRARDDMRAPIFYDNNDSSYYCDPNSTSVMWQTKSYYLTNIAAVSDNHSFGVYFDSGRSTAYAIFREGGAWNWPYPDLRIAFHTGIKFGANASYKGMNFYTDYDMSSLVMSVNNADYVTSGVYVHSDLRSPIMYDANDTGFYVDPNSTSRIVNIRVDGGRYYIDGGATGEDGGNSGQICFTSGGGMTIGSIQTTFVTGFAGSGYPDHRGVGMTLTYNKNLNVIQAVNEYYSDERLKRKTGTLDGALDIVKNWVPFRYVDNDIANTLGFASADEQIGLSAQEVQASYPQLVKLAPFDTESDFSDEGNPRQYSKSGENYLTLDYKRLIPVLVQAIKEQQAKIEELERSINNS
jgi:hypothetical protein